MNELDKELMMAQIHKLKAETEEINSQREVKQFHLRAEIERIHLDAEKIRAETLKIQKETKYYPAISLIVALLALVASIIAIMK